jgi:hypothetical protein
MRASSLAGLLSAFPEAEVALGHDGSLVVHTQAGDVVVHLQQARVVQERRMTVQDEPRSASGERTVLVTAPEFKTRQRHTYAPKERPPEGEWTEGDENHFGRGAALQPMLCVHCGAEQHSKAALLPCPDQKPHVFDETPVDGRDKTEPSTYWSALPPRRATRAGTLDDTKAGSIWVQKGTWNRYKLTREGQVTATLTSLEGAAGCSTPYEDLIKNYEVEV